MRRSGPQNDGNVFVMDDARLDWEWGRQASLLHDACLRLSEAQAEEDDADRRFDLAKSEVWKDLRDNPKMHGLGDKPTVDDIKQGVPRHAAYQHALMKLNEAKDRVRVLAAYVSAVRERRSILEHKVILLRMSFGAEPRVPPEVAGAVRDQYEAAKRAGFDGVRIDE